MFVRKCLLVLLSSLHLMDQAQVVLAQQDAVQIHGSGSSATRRCFWHVMETMSGQTKIPIRGTYRSTGSGTGVKEFIGNVTRPYNHFGSSDYPLPKENFEALANAGVEMVHLPVVMGAVAVFHSLPLAKEDASTNLNLTSCLIARIYKGEIEDWTHPDILAINPSFEIADQFDFYGNLVENPSLPITVAHRSDGSGTTNTFTSYLHKACPEQWGEELFGSSIAWPMDGNERLIPGSGTSEMIALFSSGLVGLIGYSDAGSALDAGLEEAALKVEESNLRSDDFFLTAQNALNKNGVAAALEAEGTQIPDSGDVDWSAVDPVNQVEGYLYAWPMSALTYVYVRKDLTSVMPDPRAQSLLKAFLLAMYDDEYVGKCEEEFGFLAIKDGLRDLALQSIDMIQMSSDAPEWIQEDDVLADGVGQGDYVISTRRGVSSIIEQEFLKDQVSRTDETLQATLDLLDVIQAETKETAAQVNSAVSAIDFEKDSILQELKKRADTSFIVAIVALCVCVLVGLWVICKQESRIRHLENLPTPMLNGKPKPKKRRSDQVEHEA